jgi:hypothetical protein
MPRIMSLPVTAVPDEGGGRRSASLETAAHPRQRQIQPRNAEPAASLIYGVDTTQRHGSS